MARGEDLSTPATSTNGQTNADDAVFSTKFELSRRPRGAIAFSVEPGEDSAGVLRSGHLQKSIERVVFIQSSIAYDNTPAHAGQH